ncbi:hypothetical protein Pla175_21080 [Pirellulimonas nuda]|uniref:Prenyltransferase and squalene oxidase repeat protein n=1 Tax=Pirellulimonas nuda TaxID=2528009 RepID=A0A518DB69_9BACT|nr:HEAT repeat domain-containing protein [Pirellulimonas nuda]QDU88727.1 hypothetical protein Pla175_21080 [Pirellulimonas nuda]
MTALSTRLLLFLAVAASVGPALGASQGLTPESPEVRKLIESGLAAIEKMDGKDEELGAKCLMGLAFVKDDKPDHPKVQQAVAACYETAKKGYEAESFYSAGLAIILLTEVNPRTHASVISYYFNLLKQRQKKNGGWGYTNRESGDTSQTQYAALSYWEAHRHGLSVEAAPLAGLTDWLIRTQDPDGAWGYQGEMGPAGKRVEQKEISLSMVSAALGSVLITIDLFGIMGPNQSVPSEEELPTGVRVAGEESTRRAPRLSSKQVERDRLIKAYEDGTKWMEKNYSIDNKAWQVYYLYALERFRGFEEFLTGVAPGSPKWYNDGYDFLLKNQKKPGIWDKGCGEAADTAFAVLFLQRSTQKILRASIGEGLMLSGRGLPKDLSSVRLDGGQIVAQQEKTAVEDLLGMLDEDQSAKLDALADDPSALISSGLDARSARRLEQLVRGGDPEVRLLAVRALGRTGNLDYVPSLLYGLTDPDKRVVLAARDGLRFTSRKFQGYGLNNRFSENQRYEAKTKWEQWYLSVRPDAVLPAN